MNGAKFDLETAKKQMAQIKDPNRNRHIVEALEFWIAAGAPREDGKWPSLSRRDRATNGAEQVPLRHITLEVPSRNSGFMTHDGDADRDTMLRVDLFELKPMKAKVRWEGVPIYLHQLLDRKRFADAPPFVPKSKTISGTFAISLQRGDFVELFEDQTDAPTNQAIAGYYIKFDIDGKIGLRSHEKSRDKDTVMRRFKKLLTIKKYSVDRFGRKNLVEREKRTWRGAVCTSPIPPG